MVCVNERRHHHELVEITVIIRFLPKKAVRLYKTQHFERLTDIEILLTNDARPDVLRRDIHVLISFVIVDYTSGSGDRENNVGDIVSGTLRKLRSAAYLQPELLLPAPPA